MDDVLVVGEALVDIVLRQDGTRDEHPGGSPANVALGLGRLGRSVSLLTRIGPDARGEAISDRLADSDVRLLDASRSGQATSTATAHLDPAGVASYDFDIDWRLPEAARSVDALTGDGVPARALHTGSIAAFLSPGGDTVLDLVGSARGRMTVSYDPNARPRLMGEPAAARERVERFVALSDVVKVSDEDLAWLYPGADPSDVIDAWLAAGPSIVVLTRGGEGALAVARSGRADVGGQRITVVDTVGAGDSFTSALLDFLAGRDLLGEDRLAALREVTVRDLSAMLEHAVTVSAITCGRAGADPPRRSELPGG